MGKSDEAKGSDYGNLWATDYDARYNARNEEHAPEQAVAFLLERWRGGAVLELGVGTGRVALPLAKARVEVHGLDNSEQMLRRLREKPGARQIVCWRADMSSYRTQQLYSMVYCVFNSLLLLTEAAAQAAVFTSTRKALLPNGLFVVEALVPNVAPYQAGPLVQFRRDANGVLELRVALLFEERQRVENYYYQVGAHVDELSIRTTFLRYCSTDQLDAMATAAGFRLVERWSNWSCAEFSAHSNKHVSVYRKR